MSYKKRKAEIILILIYFEIFLKLSATDLWVRQDVGKILEKEVSLKVINFNIFLQKDDIAQLHPKFQKDQ